MSNVRTAGIVLAMFVLFLLIYFATTSAQFN